MRKQTRLKNKKVVEYEEEEEQQQKEFTYRTAMLINGDCAANYLNHEKIRNHDLVLVALSFNDAEYAYSYLEWLVEDPESGYPIPDYIFMAVDLPGKYNAYEFLKKIKHNLPFTHFRVYLISKAPINKDLLSGIKFPTVEHIPWPLTERHIKTIKHRSKRWKNWASSIHLKTNF